ncbi:hypothetical protein [Anaerovibrio sp.]|uniref:hypothetical protein n=1 Tax=Anaerovibrio sp. TaxID=1872532 RepID=UPI0025C5EE4A|nr:hypothetical protein [Anaerovibrio sp.]MBR2141768.1 hypothetical protein [Anaerovibrio sp.]
MNVKKILVVVVIGIIVGATVVLCLGSNVPDYLVELTQLENNLMELSDLNDKQSEMLSQQQIQLQESEEKLSLAEQESEKLQNQIYSLRKEMIE